MDCAHREGRIRYKGRLCTQRREHQVQREIVYTEKGTPGTKGDCVQREGNFRYKGRFVYREGNIRYKGRLFTQRREHQVQREIVYTEKGTSGTKGDCVHREGNIRYKGRLCTQRRETVNTGEKSVTKGFWDT